MMKLYRGAAVVAIVMYLAAFYPAGKNTHSCKCRQHSSDCPCCVASVAGPMGTPQVPSKTLCSTKQKEEGSPKLPQPYRCETSDYHLNDIDNDEPELLQFILSEEKENYYRNKREKKPKLSGFCTCKEKKDRYKNFSNAVLIKLEIIGSPSGHDKIFCWKKGLLLLGYHRPPMKPPFV
jgi:hypothetical protein